MALFVLQYKMVMQAGLMTLLLFINPRAKGDKKLTI